MAQDGSGDAEMPTTSGFEPSESDHIDATIEREQGQGDFSRRPRIYRMSSFNSFPVIPFPRLPHNNSVADVDAVSGLELLSKSDTESEEECPIPFPKRKNKEAESLGKIDIKGGQGVRGEIEGDSDVMIIRELPSTSKSFLSLRNGCPRTDSCESLGFKLRSTSSDTESHLEGFSLSQLTLDSHKGDEKNTDGFAAAATPLGHRQIQLNRTPLQLQSKDVFAIYSPSKGIFEIKKCQKDFVAGKDLEQYLMDESIGIFGEDYSYLSTAAIVGSPPPVFNVSAILFDAPGVTHMTDDAIKLFDKERNRYGVVEKIGGNVAHVEILKTGAVVMDVPLDDLLPHPAARIRCGQYVALGDWIGMVREVERVVHLKLKDGKKAKVVIDDKNAEGTFVSYLTGGRTSPWDEAGDIFNDPRIPMYPGQVIKIDKDLVESHLVSYRSRFGQCFTTGFRHILRRQPRRERKEVDATVKKVEATFVQVIWVDRIEGSDVQPPPCGFKRNIDDLKILGPSSQSFIEIGSLRMYTVKQDELMMDGDLWKQEMAQRYMNGAGGKNPSTDDVYKKKTVNTDFFKKSTKKIKPGDDTVVRVLLTYRIAEILWEDGVKENMEMPKVLQLIQEDNTELPKESLPDKGTFGQPSKDQKFAKCTVQKKKDEVGLPSLGISFKVNDFVIDAIHLAPTGTTQYGIVRKIFLSEFLLKVDWFEVNEGFQTTKLAPDTKQPDVSVFDVLPMNESNDPEFRIIWKNSKDSYGSEIVCPRLGVNMLEFKSGYMTGIAENGKVIARSDDTIWYLWPCEIVGLVKSCYQDEVGEWKTCTMEEKLQKGLMTSFQRKQRKQKNESEKGDGDTSLPHASSFPKLIRTVGPGADEFRSHEECIENYGVEFTQFRTNCFAPKCHELYYYFDELSGTEKEDTRVNLKQAISEDIERMKIIGLPEGVFVRGYEDRWNLFSVLMVAPRTSIYYGALFIFDVAIPENFPNEHPVVTYVSYASKMSAFLGDTEGLSRVKPFSHCVENMGNNFCVNNSASQKQVPGYKSSTIRKSIGSIDIIQPHGSLEGVIASIYDDLFKQLPDKCVNTLCSPPLELDEVPFYHAFLRGRVLESLSNFIDIPHAPWEDFIHVHHLRELQRVLLEAKYYLDESLSYFGNMTPIRGCESLLPASEGVRMYIRNRMKYFM